MDNKEISKKYLISAAALYVVGAILLFAFIYGAGEAGLSQKFADIKTAAALSALLPLIPTGSYTGFVFFGTRIKEISAKKAWAVVILFPLLLVIVTVSGIVLIVPEIIRSVLILSKR